MKKLQLTSRSLDRFPAKRSINEIVLRAISAVDPYLAVRNAFHFERAGFLCGGKYYAFEDIGQIWVIGAGKAGFPMAKAIVDLFSERHLRGCVIVKDGHTPLEQLTPDLVLREAGHPVPDERGVQATQEMIALLSNVAVNDLVICLISGGGSALLTSPAVGLTLDDIQRTTDLLLKSGVEIQAINRVRKHLDVIKGGGLAKLILPAKGITLILSDVLGDPLESIASGPTVPDPSTFQEAFDVINNSGLENMVPERVFRHLLNGINGRVHETAKPGEPFFERLHEYIVGSNVIAAQAACAKAAELGFNTILLTTYLQGEARSAGRFFATILKQIAMSDQPIQRPAMVIAGGETTVTVHGNGLGGRNLEFALGAVREMAGLKNACLLALATDGGDGPTDAAGAIVTGETMELARSDSMLPEDYLDRNDSYHYFSALNDLIITGPTLTNVNDLYFGFIC